MKFLRLGIVAISLLALSAGSAFAWGNASNCTGCHPALDAGGELHTLHNSIINDCGWCHSADNSVRTNTSELAAENGCNGCHTLGGLYAIHTAANCGCHSADPPPAGLESDVPPYYGTAATPYGESRVCWDELDNDGDGDVDKGDQDCANVDNEWKSWSTIKEHYGE